MSRKAALQDWLDQVRVFTLETERAEEQLYGETYRSVLPSKRKRSRTKPEEGTSEDPPAANVRKSTKPVMQASVGEAPAVAFVNVNNNQVDPRRVATAVSRGQTDANDDDDDDAVINTKVAPRRHVDIFGLNDDDDSMQDFAVKKPVPKPAPPCLQPPSQQQYEQQQ